MLMNDYYEVLRVGQRADEVEIKRSYRKLATRFHPDKFPIGSEDAARGEERLKDINEAYSVLGNADKRAVYDAQIGASNPHSRRPSSGFQSGFNSTSNSPYGYRDGYEAVYQDIYSTPISDLQLQDIRHEASNIRAMAPVAMKDERLRGFRRIAEIVRARPEFASEFLHEAKMTVRSAIPAGLFEAVLDVAPEVVTRQDADELRRCKDAYDLLVRRRPDLGPNTPRNTPSEAHDGLNRDFSRARSTSDDRVDEAMKRYGFTDEARPDGHEFDIC